MPAAARRLPSAAGRHAPRYSAAADAVPASRGPAPAPALSGSGPDSGCGWSAAGGWADRRPAADRSRRRLLEGFEQGIGGIQIHRLGRMQYHYLAPTLLRCLCHEVGQLPYRIDTNGLAFLRSEERRVGKSVDLGGRRIMKKKKHKSQEYTSR